nr:MAG TPA: hypothetical protein [Caudoviricetes sp.]DAT42590.1 MAG TPA: hypothetical protein [Caudoviricetes sp.]
MEKKSSKPCNLYYNPWNFICGRSFTAFTSLSKSINKSQ